MTFDTNTILRNSLIIVLFTHQRNKKQCEQPLLFVVLFGEGGYISPMRRPGG